MVALLQSPRCCSWCCCCCCCCCGCAHCSGGYTCVLRQVQHEMQRAFVELSGLSVSLFPSHFSPSASSAPSRVSPTQLPLRTCSAACLAARQVLRRLLAVRMCGPLSTRIHHALCHHVMCLFDTWHSSCTEFPFSCCLHPGPQLLWHSLPSS